LGSWGYLQAIAEVEEQVATEGLSFDRIYFGCGSGGTAAGLALGVHYSSLQSELVALGVDDTPDDFYAKLTSIFADMAPTSAPLPDPRTLLRIEDSVGIGYAQSTEAELRFVREVAQSTGVVLDPVYSGKAAMGMVGDLERRPAARVLFIHTGGLLGLYEKDTQLKPLLEGGWTSWNA